MINPHYNVGLMCCQDGLFSEFPFKFSAPVFIPSQDGALLKPRSKNSQIITRRGYRKITVGALLIVRICMMRVQSWFLALSYQEGN